MTTLLRGCNNGGTNGQGKQIHKSSNANNAEGVTDICKAWEKQQITSMDKWTPTYRRDGNPIGVLRQKAIEILSHLKMNRFLAD